MRVDVIAPISLPRLLWRSFIVVLAAIVPLLCLSAVHAATITSNTQKIASSNRARPLVLNTLRLTGMIETGDADKLREALARFPASIAATPDAPLTLIELSSMGGSVTEGLEIGTLLRKFHVIAVVRKQDFCLSACALAFLGGNVHHVPSTFPDECNVEIGGKVAFHNFFLNRNGLRAVTSEDPVASRLQGFNDARGGAALLIKYAGEMGLQPNFVASIVGRPVEDFQYIDTVALFLSLHVCPLGVDRPSVALAVQANNICSHSTGWLDPSLPLEARLIPPKQAKLYLLERVQKNMQTVKTKGRLADQLASYAVMRVNEEIDRLYEDLRGAGVALPDILGPTFEIGRFRANNYETVCYVSLSAENPDSFDVAVQGPKGLSQPLQSPPENCRRLFLFDRNDVINPRPG